MKVCHKSKIGNLSNVYFYRGKVTNVVDGDTLDIEFDLGFNISIIERVRLSNIDAYETTLRDGTTEAEKRKGIEAKAFLTNLVEGESVEIETLKDKKGKFGRYLANVSHEGKMVNDIMVEKGYAVEYPLTCNLPQKEDSEK